MINATVKVYWKHLSSISWGFIVALFFSQSGESIHDLPIFNLIYEVYNTINQHYQK